MKLHALAEHCRGDHDVSAIGMVLSMASNRPKPFVQRAKSHGDVAVVLFHRRPARRFGILAIGMQYSRSCDGCIRREIEEEGGVMSQSRITDRSDLGIRLPL